jgi:tetratricopeptide (TPR) repeat protein
MKTSRIRPLPGHVPALLLALPRRTFRGLVAAAPLFLFLTLLALARPAIAADESTPEATAASAQAEPAANEGEGAAKPSSTVRPEVAERLLVANHYLEDGKPDDALAVVDELAQIRKLKPVDRAQIHRFRGYILISKSKTDEAGQEFEAALAENALDDSARQGMMYSLAQIYTQSGRFDRARELIDRWFATAADPKPEAYFLKAMILVQQEAFAEALEPARTAVERSPQVRESWLQLLAAIQFQLQDYAGLTDTLKKLIAVAPGTKRYWVQLATIENSIGKENEALATLGIADVAGLLKEDKEIRQRARMLFVRDLPETCARTLEEGLEAGRVLKDADAYQLLANCRIAAREIDKAVEPLKKAGELSTNAKAFLMLGQIELQKEHFAEARDALRKALPKAEPAERGSIELLIGIAELGAGRFDEAAVAFEAAKVDDKTKTAAESYLKHLEQKRALRDLQAATKKPQP